MMVRFAIGLLLVALQEHADAFSVATTKTMAPPGVAPYAPQQLETDNTQFQQQAPPPPPPPQQQGAPQRFQSVGYSNWWDNPGNYDPSKATTQGYFQTYTDRQQAGSPLYSSGPPIQPTTPDFVASPSGLQHNDWWDHPGNYDPNKATTQGYFQTFTDQSQSQAMSQRGN